MKKGTVKWFNNAKGYGFINDEKDPKKDIFVHYSQIVQDGYKTLREGEEVEFIDIYHEKGIQAHSVISLDRLREEELKKKDKE